MPEVIELNAREAIDMGLAPAIPARLNVTWNGSNGDFPDPVPYDASSEDLKAMATEAIENGSVPGIDRGLNEVLLEDFVVERYPASVEVPTNRIFLRPKTPFGAEDSCPFCDATPAEISHSIEVYGLGSPLMCEYCKRRDPLSKGWETYELQGLKG